MRIARSLLFLASLFLEKATVDTGNIRHGHHVLLGQRAEGQNEGWWVFFTLVCYARHVSRALARKAKAKHEGTC